VVERPDVDELDCNACVDNPMVTSGSKLAGDLREERPKPLAACEEEMLGDLREEGVIRDGHLGEPALDERHPIPHGRDRYETLEAG
jgi:hypothetical protein